MAYQRISVEEKFSGQITEIRLSAPPANILTGEMMGEISGAFREIGKNQHCKLVIFSGAGKHFSYGASVEEHAPGKVEAMLPSFHKMIGEILNYDIPTMAKVSGLCLGGGFELALACTFIMADDTAKFAVPEIQLGVFPPVAALLLPHYCGFMAASRLVLTGEKVTAKELWEMGAVSKVFEASALEAEVSAFIEREILPKSASSLRIAHRAVRMDIREKYGENIGRLESLYLKDLMSTNDAVEGIHSFMEKRQPRWSA